MSAVGDTRTALVITIKAALDIVYPGSEQIDVFDWFDPEYAKSICVCVEDSNSVTNRETFSTSSRIPFRENWSFDIKVIPTSGTESLSEIAKQCLEISNVIQDAIAGDTNLGGSVTGLIRCFVSNVRQQRKDTTIETVLTMNCEYRINRR